MTTQTVVAEAIRPGMLAFLLIFGLFVVTVLLWLSMRRHLGRIRFDRDPATDDAGASDPPAGSATTEPPAPESGTTQG